MTKLLLINFNPKSVLPDENRLPSQLPEKFKVFNFIYKTWKEEKKKYLETGDSEMYVFFLKQIQKYLGQIYSRIDKGEILEPLEEILNLTTCELKEISIKYKNSEIPF